MHYDPNYKNQFFHQSANTIGIAEAIQIARREINVAEYKTKMPKSKLSKIISYAILGVSALILLITAIIWLISRSVLLTLVLFVIMAFASVSIIAVIIAIADSILHKNCSDPVEATCIGYSYSAGPSHDSGGGRMERTPVFEYEYHGMKCVAFDGIYDNFSQVPLISQKTTILVNPSDPEDIHWNFGKHRQIFLILACAFGSVLSLSMLFVVLNDDNFMNSALSKEDPSVEVSSMQSSESEVPSGVEINEIKKTDDGRIILTDSYLKNEVFTAYPDSEYVIKSRKITEIEIIDDGEVYVVRFDPDPDFSESEWYFFREEVTDEVKKTSIGDEFIYAEVKENGASWIFSTKEYALEGE
ncbi:MAG: hypothetical protein IKO32_01840 [Lachnospiraceae bacterium]|nr:hypothetical protein [Lachnospiraceae bacterium]